MFGSLVLERLSTAEQVIAELVAALDTGYFVVTHIRADVAAASAQCAAAVYSEHHKMLRPRTGGEINALPAGGELLAPGLVVAADWIPDQDTPDRGESSCCWAAVGAWGGIG
nr:SAM-dependent methyltransferase [Nocardia abscessus]